MAVRVRKAVDQFLTDYPAMGLIALARNGVEPEDGIVIVLNSSDPVPVTFRRSLRNTVREARGLTVLEDFTDEKTIVRIFILQEAPLQAE